MNISEGPSLPQMSSLIKYIHQVPTDVRNLILYHYDVMMWNMKMDRLNREYNDHYSYRDYVEGLTNGYLRYEEQTAANWRWQIASDVSGNACLDGVSPIFKIDSAVETGAFLPLAYKYSLHKNVREISCILVYKSGCLSYLP